MLGPVVDVFRLRQYFDVVVQGRAVLRGLREDAGLLDAARQVLVRLPGEGRPPATPVFPPAPAVSRSRRRPRPSPRIAIAATGGSGALSSLVGVARAFEEAGRMPAAYSLCSGSALFGFPLACGIPAEEVADFLCGLRLVDGADVDWAHLATLVPSRARGFTGLLRGERLERALRALVGDRRLRDLAMPAHAPIWNVEHNRLAFLGPETHPDLPVARAIRLAVALPLFFRPAPLDGGLWGDGGIVDIFPVRPLLEASPPVDGVVAVNGFYPPDFAGEDATGWDTRRWSILDAAAQVRTCQQVQLARENLARLRAACAVRMIEPVPYETVRGVGFYRQFLDSAQWPAFMRAGREAGRTALHDLERSLRAEARSA